jgi:hypothetical protein
MSIESVRTFANLICVHETYDLGAVLNGLSTYLAEFPPEGFRGKIMRTYLPGMALEVDIERRVSPIPQYFIDAWLVENRNEEFLRMLLDREIFNGLGLPRRGKAASSMSVDLLKVGECGVLEFLMRGTTSLYVEDFDVKLSFSFGRTCLVDVSCFVMKIITADMMRLLRHLRSIDFVLFVNVYPTVRENVFIRENFRTEGDYPRADATIEEMLAIGTEERNLYDQGWE